MKSAPRIETHDLVDDDPKRGFRHAGEFFLAVKQTGKNVGNPADERLKRMAAAPTTFGNEVSGADGGFLIPIAFATEIADLSKTEDSLLPFCDQTPISGNTMSFPRDETTPWGATGIRANWQGEGTSGTQTKPSLRSDTMRLNKLLALVPLTDELADDAPALGAYLPRQVAKSIRWKVNDALLYGVGGYQPLGVFNSNAQITIAKESGQATQTLVPNNLAKMMARLPPGSFSRAIWLFNGDTLPAFFSMTTVSTIYWPAVGDSSTIPSGITAAFGLVVGRPALISAHAKSFSSQGDVILVDLSYVNVIEKAAGIQIASSLHIYFDADALAFRASFRLDAQPKLTAPIAPANGSTQLSPFTQLGAR
jgi:HK97 family phage major capsid protein